VTVWLQDKVYELGFLLRPIG